MSTLPQPKPDSAAGGAGGAVAAGTAALPQRTPKYGLLAAALLLQAVLLLWLGGNGYPRSTSDTVCFKQPAQTRLDGPHFCVPSYQGLTVHWQVLQSYPACVYMLTQYAVYRVCGFGMLSTTGLDLVVHWLLCAAASIGVARLTGRQTLGVLMSLAALTWLLPIGRPEELGMLLALAAFYVAPRGAAGWLGGAVLLGLTGVTAPGAAVVGMILVAADEALRSQAVATAAGAAYPWARLTRRIVQLCALSVFTACGIYAWFHWPNLDKALEQHRNLQASNFYYFTTPAEIFRTSPGFAWSTLAMLSAALIAAAAACRPGVASSPTPAQRRFLAAAAAAVAAGTLLNLAAGRREYDYRHVLALSAAMLLCAAGSAFDAAALRKRPPVAAAVGLVLLVGLWCASLREVARYALAGAVRDPGYVTRAEAAAMLRRFVSPEHTVGGDGAMWTLADKQHQPFIAVAFAKPKFWPEFIISSAWAEPPHLLAEDGTGKVLERDYEEITPAPYRAPGPHALKLFGVRIPITSGRCDWAFRIWRKKDASKRQASAPRSPANARGADSDARI